jgi:hypothetical protein
MFIHAIKFEFELQKPNIPALVHDRINIPVLKFSFV